MSSKVTSVSKQMTRSYYEQYQKQNSTIIIITPGPSLMQNFTRMLEKYSKLLRQKNKTSYISSISSFINISRNYGKRSCDVIDGLECLRNVICQLAPQESYAHWGRESRADHLNNDILQHKWAFTALAGCSAQEEQWSFTKLSQTLDSARLQEQQKTKQTKIIEPINNKEST